MNALTCSSFMIVFIHFRFRCCSSVVSQSDENRDNGRVKGIQIRIMIMSKSERSEQYENRAGKKKIIHSS